MPTYEFQTPDGRIVERMYKMSEVPAEITLDDGTVATRIISGGADLVFKGSGFYITDYGKDGKKAERSAPAKSDASSSGGGSASSSSTSTSSGGSTSSAA